MTAENSTDTQPISQPDIKPVHPVVATVMFLIPAGILIGLMAVFAYFFKR